MILVRYDEIALKGQNQDQFIRQLAKSIEMFFVKYGRPKPKIRKTHGRLIIETEERPAWFGDIFGICTYSYAQICPATITDIKKAADPIIQLMNTNTKFRISAKRIDKAITLRSRDVDIELGAYVVEKSGAKVDLSAYDLEIGVELVNKMAYVFDSKLKGHGGYPVGSQGKALLVLDTQIDILAGIMMMKRGCNLMVLNPAGLDLSPLARYHGSLPLCINEVNKEEIIRLDLQACVCTQRETFTGLVVLNPLVGFLENEIETLKSEYL